uniref:Uncharacterized protein n=1 Tax=Rhizophora mucronata TaxID=61149 RepID=A0A2P2P7D0_RHIMU
MFKYPRAVLDLSATIFFS